MGNDEKIFELMTKMYSEFSQFRSETNGRFDKMEGRFDKLESDLKAVKKTVLNIEQEHGKKLDALFDGYKQNTEKLNALEAKVDKIAEKVERHDIKIQVIEGGKAV